MNDDMRIAYAVIHASSQHQEANSQASEIVKAANMMGYHIPSEYIFEERNTGYEEDYYKDRDSIINLRNAIRERKPDAIFVWDLYQLSHIPDKVENLIIEFSLQPMIPLYIYKFGRSGLWTIQDGQIQFENIKVIRTCAEDAYKEKMQKRGVPPQEEKTLVDNSADKTTSLQSPSVQTKPKKNHISDKLKIIIIVVAALCAIGVVFGIHKHKIKVAATQQSTLLKDFKEEEQERQKAIEEYIARIYHQTPDLKMLSVHGPVKSIVYEKCVDIIIGMDYFVFNEEGIIIKMMRKLFNKVYYPTEKSVITRESINRLEVWENTVERTPYLVGSMGYISILAEGRDYSYFGTLSAGDDGFSQYFSYGEDDFVNKITLVDWENYTEYIKFDEYGRIIKTNGNVANGVEGCRYTKTFKYLKFDKYDNWTKVEVTLKSNCAFHNESDNYYHTETYIITRKINYYE